MSRVFVGIFMLFVFLMFVGIVVLFVVTTIRAVTKNVGKTRRNARSPILHRPATVVAKRTSASGGGNSSTRTHYFATFEFPDRSREEFELMGTDFGLLAERDQGLLTSQGTWFRAFQRGSTIQDAPPRQLGPFSPT